MSTKLTNWINQQLNERGWSIRELARRSNLSHTTINDILSDRANPGIDFCNGLARALHEPHDRVFRLAGLLPPVVGQGEETRQELLEYWTYLNQDDRDTITTLARVLYEKRAEYK